MIWICQRCERRSLTEVLTIVDDAIVDAAFGCVLCGWVLTVPADDAAPAEGPSPGRRGTHQAMPVPGDAPTGLDPVLTAAAAAAAQE